MLHSSQIKDIYQRNKTFLKHAASEVSSPPLKRGQSQVNMATNKSPNMQCRQLRHAVSAQNISLHPKVYPNEYSLPNAYQLTQSANHDSRTSPLPQTEVMPHSPKMNDRTRAGVSHFPSPLPSSLPSPILPLPPPEVMPPLSPKMSPPSSPLPLTSTESSPRVEGRGRAKCLTRSPSSPLPSPLPSPILQVSLPEKMPYSPKAPHPSSLPFAPPAIQLPSTKLTPPNADGKSSSKSMTMTGSPKLRYKALQRSKTYHPRIHGSQGKAL